MHNLIKLTIRKEFNHEKNTPGIYFSIGIIFSLFLYACSNDGLDDSYPPQVVKDFEFNIPDTLLDCGAHEKEFYWQRVGDKGHFNDNDSLKLTLFYTEKSLTTSNEPEWQPSHQQNADVVSVDDWITITKVKGELHQSLKITVQPNPTPYYRAVKILCTGADVPHCSNEHVSDYLEYCESTLIIRQMPGESDTE